MNPLHTYRQWVPVRPDKLPLDYRTGTVGSALDPGAWLPYADAKRYSPHVAFVLTAADPFWCVDIDKALQADNTSWSPLALDLCGMLPNTMREVSISGRGLHIWGQGPIPPHRAKRTDLRIELYSEARYIIEGTGQVGSLAVPCPEIAAVVARYFAPEETAGVASDAPEDGPDPRWNGPADDDTLIARMLRSTSASAVFGGGATVMDLWDARADVLARVYPSASGKPYDASSADAALAQHLAFWTGRDHARIDRLMRRSKLVREKWGREDYLRRTVSSAVARQRDVLIDRPSAAAPPPQPTSAPTGSTPSMTAVEGNTFLAPEQQAALFKGCVYIVQRNAALVPGGEVLKPDSFRAYFGGYTFAMDQRNERTTRNAWEAFTESQVLRAPRADGLCFRPDLAYGTIVAEAGRTRANKWWPVEVPRRAGDASRFLNHVRKLLPAEKDQRILLSYLAAIVQYPGRKFQWCVVLQGVEGNGKSLFSRVIAQAVGRRYTHWPKADKLTKEFNAWMLDRLVYLVEDIHTGPDSDVLEHLKPMITGDDGIEIEAKGVDQASADICGNFILNTNHKTGLRKSRNDRRLCIFFCAQQWKEDLDRDGLTPEYMHGIYRWLKHEDGYAVVTDFLHTYPIAPEFNPAGLCQRAPDTSTTEQVIAAGRGRIEQEILEAIERDEVGFRGGWVSGHFLAKFLERVGKSGAIPPNRRRDLMRTIDYDWHPNLTEGRTDNVVLPDGVKTKLYLIKRHPALEIKSPAEIARAYQAAQGATA